MQRMDSRKASFEAVQVDEISWKELLLCKNMIFNGFFFVLFMTIIIVIF